MGERPPIPSPNGGLCGGLARVPKGAVLMIPGYGPCRVEDTGNPRFVNGLHLDLFFEDIQDARQWGVQKKKRYHRHLLA